MHSKTSQCITAHYSASEDTTGHYKTSYSASQDITVHHSAVQHSTRHQECPKRLHGCPSGGLRPHVPAVVSRQLVSHMHQTHARAATNDCSKSIRISIWTCISICLFICICLCIHMCIHREDCQFVFAFVFACIFICICLCISICIHREQNYRGRERSIWVLNAKVLRKREGNPTFVCKSTEEESTQPRIN